MCFSVFCQANGRNGGGEWTGSRGDLNNNPAKSAVNMPGREKWQQPPVVPEQATIGYLHLSFEYNKSDLRIKVWQVSDLLLPPPQTSMIESFYVKSYFIPDTANKSIRRTEEVRVEPASKDGSNPSSRQNSIQHIFSSSSIKFSTPLLYTGVTQEMVSQRNIQLEVCMTQKQTGKSFLMGMVFLPLCAAVHRPIRERYPLIPCMNHTIPNNMKVYNARDIILGGSNYTLDNSQLNHRASFSGESSDKVSKFIQRFSSLNLSLDSDDEGVGGSMGMGSNAGMSFGSLTIMPDEEKSFSTDEEVEILCRKKNKPNASLPSSPSNDSNLNDSLQAKVKKKIIPNEFLSRSLSSENDETPETGKIVRRVSGKFTVVKVDEPVLERQLSEPGSAPDSGHNDTDLSKHVVGIKKKIIPNELKIDKIENSNFKNEHVDIGSEENSPSTPLSHLNNISGASAGLTKDNLKLSHRGGSESISDVASTPGSRPETPVWDFYDFTVEEGAANGEPKSEVQTSSAGDEASEALGTLQASILRLSRNPQVLDTCIVSGPVLPTVMIDDFEMEENENIVDLPGNTSDREI